MDEQDLDPDFAERFHRERRPPCQLYLISPQTLSAGFEDRLRAALDAAPVAAFQLRLKGIDDHAIARAAEPLQSPRVLREGEDLVDDDRPHPGQNLRAT